MNRRSVRWYGVGLTPRTIEELARQPGWEPVGLARDVAAAPHPRERVDLWLLQGGDLAETLRWGKALQPLIGEGRLCVLVPEGASQEVWRAAVEAVVGAAPAVRTVASVRELSEPAPVQRAEAGGQSPPPAGGGALPAAGSGTILQPSSPVDGDASGESSARPAGTGTPAGRVPPPARVAAPGNGTGPLAVAEPPRLAGRGRPVPPPGSNGWPEPLAPAAGGAVVVAVVGPKGGVGRTWLSCELAASMAAAGERVGLIDACWAAGDAGVLLDLTGGPTILDLQPVLDGPSEAWEEQWLVHPRTGLRFLAAPPRPELAGLVEPGVLSPVLAWARQRFRLVVVDCPGTDPRGGEMRDWLGGGVCWLLVTTPAPTSLRQARAWLEEWLLRGEEKGHRIAVVVNRWTGAGAERHALEEYLRHPVSAWLPDDAAAVDAAIASGVPLVLSAPSHPLAAAVQELAGRMLGREFPEPGRAGGRLWQALLHRVRRNRSGLAGTAGAGAKGSVG